MTYARATGCACRSPDFMLVGAQKGGTTDLYERLSNQTELYTLRGVQQCRPQKQGGGGRIKCQGEKELHFFDFSCLFLTDMARHFRAGKRRGWCDAGKYAAHIREVRLDSKDYRGQQRPPGTLTGEATSTYLFLPEVTRPPHKFCEPHGHQWRVLRRLATHCLHF